MDLEKNRLRKAILILEAAKDRPESLHGDEAFETSSAPSDGQCSAVWRKYGMDMLVIAIIIASSIPYC